MRFDRLRISGFKSFVDPTELLIKPGMTGVVGPNGCGKSNLLEALRWVMGETSYKSLRGSGMEDVIFAGAADRPARNTAEVTVTLDNSRREAPAQFNADDVLEVSRRIERDAGSAYRVNGRDTRARDVQMLFADASTGAHSIALVRQGQIGEIISAKPQARRRILEEAAGISGLHHRRHEAELRLRAAEQNLERLDDVLGEIETQLSSLKRQARQAARYREVAEGIRKAEALLLHLKWTEATEQLANARGETDRGRTEVQALTRDAAIASKSELDGGEALPAMREAETAAAAALQRLRDEDRSLAAEAERAAERARDLADQIERIGQDFARETQLLAENGAQIAALTEEEAGLRDAIAGQAGAGEAALAAAAAARATLTESEAELAAATARLAELRAERSSLDARIREIGSRAGRFESELDGITAKLEAMAGETTDLSPLESGVGEAEAAVTAAETASSEAETILVGARDAESAARDAAAETNNAAERLKAEAAALVRLADDGQNDGDRLIDVIEVASGYEQALVAALGDDLEGGTDEGTALHWRSLDVPTPEAALPGGTTSLADHVSGSDLIQRRLAFTGVVAAEEGARLQLDLAPGQRLVSVEGDLWRWDGFVARTGAPTAASRRLEARNGLVKVRGALEAALQAREASEATHREARDGRIAAEKAERDAREAWRAAGAALREARAELDAREKATRAARESRIALEEARTRLAGDLAEAREALAAAEATREGLADVEAADAALEPLRDRVATERQSLAEADSAARGLAREAEDRAARLARIANEIERWRARAENAEAQKATLATREADAKATLAEIANVPETVATKRSALADAVREADVKRQEAADRLAEAETRQGELSRRARELEGRLGEAREALARAEARLEAAEERLAECTRAILEALAMRPEGALAASGHQEGETLPGTDETEVRLTRLRADRDRLGAVNLRAEDEAREQSERLDTLTAERADLEAAIRRLRQGISSLNSEARGRLLEAFERVNGHFRDLFQQLFGGGTAELTMTEADDPLEAGLEIVARPPGKKAQVLTLLSGGEQALAAISLILAVFRTNPSPICVLDEVDAPLDDANVERFCNVIELLARESDTRFLVITHHPFSMARMDRLFGVTMAERGVSQLVSVDLDTAHTYREAG